MKASELIANLAKLISEKGDLEVMAADNTGYRNPVSVVGVDRGEYEQKNEEEIFIG